jgi:hypothetical protein
MPKYRVKAVSFIDNSLRQEGDVVEFDGIPADNLEPMQDEGDEAAAEFVQAKADSLLRQQFAAAGGDPNDAAALEAFAKDQAAKTTSGPGVLDALKAILGGANSAATPAPQTGASGLL